MNNLVLIALIVYGIGGLLYASFLVGAWQGVYDKADITYYWTACIINALAYSLIWPFHILWIVGSMLGGLLKAKDKDYEERKLGGLLKAKSKDYEKRKAAHEETSANVKGRMSKAAAAMFDRDSNE